MMTSCDETLKKGISEITFEGKINEIYRDLNNHYAYTFTIKTQENDISIVADDFPESWNYAEIGDSIFKQKEEMNITIKKKNGECGRFFYKR